MLRGRGQPRRRPAPYSPSLRVRQAIRSFDDCKSQARFGVCAGVRRGGQGGAGLGGSSSLTLSALVRYGHPVQLNEALTRSTAPRYHASRKLSMYELVWCTRVSPHLWDFAPPHHSGVWVPGGEACMAGQLYRIYDGCTFATTHHHAKHVHHAFRGAVDAATSPAHAQGHALSSCPPPSKRAVCDGHRCNRSGSLAPADQKRDRACAARSPRSAGTPSTSTTPSEGPSTPLHRSHTPNAKQTDQSPRAHRPQCAPPATAIGAPERTGWRLPTESDVVRALHVRHDPPSRQARPPRPPRGCRCRCFARTRPGSCTQFVSTTLEESRLRWPSVQPIWLAGTCGPKA